MLSAIWKCPAFVLFIMDVTVVSSNISSNENHSFTPFKTFPMLYFSKQDTLLLQSRSSDSHETIAREIRAAGQELTKRPSFFLPPKNHTVFASRWNEVYGNNLCGFAIYCFLYPQDEAAFSLIKKFMDNMASYPDWYVASSYGIDEVPIGHSLYGFTTAFDMLYDRFSSTRIRKYQAAIKMHSLTLFSILSRNRHGWSRQYIHNHAATNIVALLMGGLVISVTEPETAAPWITEARKHLEIAMEILKHVTDGSLDEGVSYGSYTSRGLTTYVFLAKRHFGVDHTSNPWLKEHFWFYYNTILPGFQRSVGIGDANHNWFYGPCSQLVFLDNFVLKNGYGNWLADKIRLSRPKNKPLAPSNSSVYSTLHTEYIFYNATITPRRPKRCDNSKLRIFSDWGVVTYGAGQRMKAGNTFFSVKSGIANGEAVENIRLNKYYPTMINDWKSFNPGHEHPDQNSFTFSPNGRYFITEALYGPKLTILDNTYSFAPSIQSSCNEPWEGQIGECAKWLRFKEFQPGVRGQILAATTSEDMAFIAAEAGNMYSKSLGIAGYFRGVLLLNPEVLIVIDSIRLRPGSKTTMASATFHNMLHPFKPYKYQKYEGAQINYPEGSYKVFSMNISGQKAKVTLHEGFRPEYLREGPTNYINVTFPLDRDVTTIAHVFSGPRNPIKSLSTIKSTPVAIVLKLLIGGVLHEVNISTVSRSWSKKISAVKERIRFLGFPGYAKVRVGSKLQYFGYSDNPPSTPSSIFSMQRNSTELVDQDMFRYTMSDLQCQRRTSSVSTKPSTIQHIEVIRHQRPALVMAVTGLSFISVALIAVISPQSKIFLIRKIRSNASTVTRGAFVLLLLISVNLCCIESDGSNVCVGNAKPRLRRSVTVDDTPRTEVLSSYPSSPFIFSFSLPASGGDVLENLFGSPSDFLVLSSAQRDLAIPVDAVNSMSPDLCSWSVGNHEIGVIPSGWLTSLTLRPFLHLNQAHSSKRSEHLRQQVREYPLSSIVLFDNMGFWMTKIPWIESIVGDNLLPLLMVRDPRSWIHAITNDSDKQRREKTISGLVDAYDRMQSSCGKLGVEPPAFFEKYTMHSTSSVHLSEKLAVVWSVAISNALASTNQLSSPRPIHVVRFEDIITQTEDASSDLFSRLGFPLGLKHISNVTRLVRSTFYRTPYDGIITPSTLNKWRVNLHSVTIKKITKICCPVMEKLGYGCDLR